MKWRANYSNDLAEVKFACGEFADQTACQTFIDAHPYVTFWGDTEIESLGARIEDGVITLAQLKILLDDGATATNQVLDPWVRTKLGLP